MENQATTQSMREKSAQVLELPKILERLTAYTSFSAGAELARSLAPTTDLVEAEEHQRETTECRELLALKTDLSTGGVRDVRPAARAAARGGILESQTLLDIRGTLQRATMLRRSLTRLRGQFPLLAGIAERLEECAGLQQEISRVLSETGDVLDSASPKLATVRHDLRGAFDRLQTRLNRLISNPNTAKFLQEALITQRNGRYVIPIKAEFKGRIQGIVHDQSSSGATLFIEPLATVEINNAWRELQLEEENEVRRILQALSELVGHEAAYIVRTVETLAHLDLIMAKARYAKALRAAEPKLVLFQERPARDHPGSAIRLIQARHPLLHPETVVPIDVELDDQTYALVITGPNTGGKTVALKTVGLLALMAQCGLHIPAEAGSALPLFNGVYADIGDEQSIEQSLSTFSAHLTNIIGLLAEADERSLVLLDELGAGTDPAEGSALARAVLNTLLRRGITTLVTTHHPELKIYSQDKPGVRNASVEFDLETLAPTYRLVVGLPGRSNALAIAARLGLPQSIIEEARSMVTADDLAADDLLDEIHKTREATRAARDLARTALADAEARRDELTHRLGQIEQERRDLLAEARQAATAELDQLRAEIRRLRRDLLAAGQPLHAIRAVEAEVRQLEAHLAAPVASAAELPPEDAPRFRLGDTVWVTPLRSVGVIHELTAEDAEILIGRLRVRARLDELAPRRSEEQPDQRHFEMRSVERRRGASPGLELDLRGARVEDALTQVENYLDAAFLAGLPFVRIIHGKGTGALRQAIRDTLKDHPLVSAYQRADEKAGGDGVTVVNMAPTG